MLVLVDDKEEIFLRTDASQESIAAVLETKDRRPIFFCSRTLNYHESKLDIV